MKISKNLRSLFGWIGILFCLILVFILTRPKYSTFEDAQLKSLQAYGLLSSALSSEALPYPGESLDPKLDFFPLENHIFIQGKPIGVFPIALAYIAVPILYLFGFGGLPYISLAGLVFILWQLRRFWNFSNSFLVIGLLGTYLFSLAVEYSEITIFLSLLSLSILFLFRRKYLYSGLFVGASVWFRHEGILYAASTLLSIWILEGFPPFPKSKRKLDSNTFKFLYGFLILFLAFLLFNWIRYSEPMGPRFSANFGQDAVMRSMPRFYLVIGFLFLNWKNNPFLIGFFLYMPFALYVLGSYIRSFGRLSERRKALILSTILFLFMVVFTAPNTGGIDFGPRYLSPAILPVLLLSRWLWIRKFSRLKKNAVKFLYSLSFAIPILLTVLGVATLIAGRKENETILNHLRNLNVDVYVFHNQSVVFFLERDYVLKKVFCSPTESGIYELLDRIRKEGKETTRVAFVQFKDDPITAYKLETPRKDPLTGSMIRPKPWNKETLDRGLSGRMSDLKFSPYKLFDIWVGSISEK
ncbi:LA_3751/LA_3752 family putative glycosyltransferase [Leptospira wolffii]|uniref:LA_3751/LA_3752 family putative glycosyltransferase n=1 Tax=Leptospira wolffii TaxID=409998 RepID=A0ABV5BJN6_9LEPT